VPLVAVGAELLEDADAAALRLTVSAVGSSDCTFWNVLCSWAKACCALARSPVLEGLPDVVEIILALVVLEILAIREGTTLAKSLDGTEFLLRGSCVSGLERLAKFLQVRLSCVQVLLGLLGNRAR
jgi:hypothetical protein